MEIACLTRVRDGFQSKEIALELGRSAKTVDKHIENACRKFGVGSRREAARLLEAVLVAGDLRNDSVEAPLPLPEDPNVPSLRLRKGDLDAALGTPSALHHLGGAGGDFRGVDGDDRGVGDGAQAAGSHTETAAVSFAARRDARDTLHRARSAQRERSTAHAAPAAAGRLRKLAMIPVIAAIAVAVLAALLGGAVQLQLAVQALDHLLAGR